MASSAIRLAGRSIPRYASKINGGSFPTTRQPYFIGAWAGFAKGVDQFINAKPALRPKRALTLVVLRLVAFFTQAYRSPIVRLLTHASTGTDTNVSAIYWPFTATNNASMRPYKIAMFLRNKAR
jgi:hypothetical protein